MIRSVIGAAMVATAAETGSTEMLNWSRRPLRFVTWAETSTSTAGAALRNADGGTKTSVASGSGTGASLLTVRLIAPVAPSRCVLITL